MSLGDWQQPAMKMPSVVVATGSSLGWLSMNQPSLSWLMLTSRATSSGVLARLHADHEHDEVGRDVDLLAGQFSLTSMSISQSSFGPAWRISGWSFLPYMRKTVLISELRR